jgi:CDP-glucose 4,6-dehydratase
VTGYALSPPTTPSNFVVSRVRELLADNHDADIRDAVRLGAAVKAADPDVVFHLAAQPLVRDSYARPRETFEVNVIGTAGVLDAVRDRAKPCVVVVVTSDKCYENREHVWGYRESDAMGGHDPYSASKGAAELVASAYRSSFFPVDAIAQHGVKLATVRAGNVIGGGDWALDRLVPDVVRALSSGQPVPVRNPDAVRPWQHVLDPLAGYLLLASRMLGSDDAALCSGWNFGPLPGEDVPVSHLVDLLVKAWKQGSWVDVRKPGQPHEATTLRLSVEKAIYQLGWMPRWGLRETAQRTARWYERYVRTGECMRDACRAEIADYERNDTRPQLDDPKRSGS